MSICTHYGQQIYENVKNGGSKSFPKETMAATLEHCQIVNFILIFYVFWRNINQLLSRTMFRDDNDEFMKSFATPQDQNKEVTNVHHPIPIVNQAASKKLRRYCENASFNMVSEQSDEKSINSKQNEMLEISASTELTNLEPKKINWIKQTMSTSRKFSDANLVVSIKKYQEEETADFNMPAIDQESEVASSYVFDDKSKIQQIQGPEIKQNEPPEEDLQTYYMKKVRLLETKFKQLNLLYENMVMQLKKQNKKVCDQLKIYQEQIKKYQPTMELQIRRIIEEKQQNMSFFSSSSSSSSKKSQDISIPVISQIMEVKIQGKKLCDTVKELTNKVRELQKINCQQLQITKTNKSTSSFLNPDNCLAFSPSPNKNLHINPQQKNQWSRKYSIPAIYSRHKKQSFQTSVISGRQQNDNSKRQKSTVVCTEYGKAQNTNALAQK